MGFLKRTADFTPHPKGSFIFTIVDVEKDDGQFGPQLKWWMDSTETDPANGKIFRKPYWTSFSLSEKGKLYGLIEAAGFDPTDAYWDSVEDITGFDPLFNKEVMGQVSHAPGKEPGTIKDRIDTVIAVPKRGPASTPALPPANSSQPAPERELAGVGAGSRPGPANRPDFGDDD